jgi:fibronectin-binding autotransporter adhesin
MEKQQSGPGLAVVWLSGSCIQKTPTTEEQPMSSVSWTATTSGNWNTGSDWSNGVGPGPTDDATINTSASITVTYSTGNATVLSLYTGFADTLLVTGGKLGITGNSALNGTVSQSGGTLTLGGNLNTMNSGLQQTSGTVKISSGTLTIANSSSIAGTVTGATLNLSSGTDTIGAAAVLSVAELSLSGANVTLNESLTQAGLFSMSNGQLNIGANTLTLDGITAITQGVQTGSGTLTLAGPTNLGSNEFEGNLVVSNTGTLDQISYSYIGYNGTDSVSFTNTAGALWRFDGDMSLYGNANSTIKNLGTMEKVEGAGITYIRDDLTSAGTINVAVGDIQIDGASNVLGGVISGAGTLELTSGSDSLSNGMPLTVGNLVLDGANVTLTGNLAYGGTADLSSGTLSVGADTLTLSGPLNLEGGVFAGSGKVMLGGLSQFGDGYFTGSVQATNTGTIEQSGYLYVGYNGTDTVSFTNASGGIYRLEGGNTIYGTAGSSFTNAGSFIKTSAATSQIYVSFASTGTLAVNAGQLTLVGSSNSLGGTISGAGTLALNGGTDSFAKTLKLSVADVLLQNGVLTLASKLTYANIYEQTGGTLTLGKFAFTLSGTSTSLDGGALQGSGTLALKGGSVYSYAIEDTSQMKNTGTLTINSSLYDGYNGTDAASLVNSGGNSAIILNEDANIYGTAGSTLTSAGLIDKASGAGISVIEPSMSSTGKIDIVTGTLRLQGASDSISGSVYGGGTLELTAGTDTLGSGLGLTVSNLLMDGATVNLGGALSYGGSLNETTGTLGLGTDNLALTGPFSLSGGYITGTGTITSSGTATITGGALSGAAIMQNSGTLVQSGSWYVGYNSTDTAKLQNLAGATWRIANASTVYGTAGALVSNAGTIVKVGNGASQITPTFANTGTVSVDAGTLYLAGTANTLGGTFNGGGTLRFNGGTDTISGATLGVGTLAMTGANVTLGSAESFANSLYQTAGTLALGANTLSLGGQDALYGGAINGTGTLALTGSTQILGAVALENAVVATNSGTISALSSFYDGYNATDTASIQNLAAGTLLLGAVEIYSQTGDTIVNAGMISKALGGSGEAYIQAATSNTGTVSVTQGTLAFLGSVTGNGQFVIGATSEMIFGGAVSGGGTATLGDYSVLGLSATAGFSDTIAGFTTGNVIDLDGMSYTGTLSTFSFNSTKDQLAVGNGSSSITLQLAGSHTASSFFLFNDNGIVGVGYS